MNIFADVFDAVYLRNERRRLLKLYQDKSVSDEKLIEILKELNKAQEKYIEDYKKLTDEIFDQNRKYQKIIQDQKNQLAVLSESKTKVVNESEAYKRKVDAMVPALKSVRNYLSKVADSKDYLLIVPIRGQILEVECAIREAERPI